MKAHLTLLMITLALVAIDSLQASAQNAPTYMRIAKITVDSARLEEYKAALTEQMQAAIKLEQGVLSYAAVQDKKNPTRITILETYASTAAYQAHTQTAHFKKYKTTVADMVKELELTDVVPIAIQSKSK